MLAAAPLPTSQIYFYALVFPLENAIEQHQIESILYIAVRTTEQENDIQVEMQTGQMPFCEEETGGCVFQS